MESHVYVIGSTASTIVKIGVSKEPPRRLREIQAMSPLRLEILWTCSGSYELEAGLHESLSAFRSHGEWFDFRGLDPVTAVQEAVDRVAKAKPPHASTAASSVKARVPKPRNTSAPCVCGHRYGEHGTSGCIVTGWDEHRDCQCSTYVGQPALEATPPATRAPIPRVPQIGWQGPTPSERVAANRDERYASVLDEVEATAWPNGTRMVPGYWPQALAVDILWRLRSEPDVTRWSGIVLDEALRLKWPQGAAMVPGAFAEELADRITARIRPEVKR